MFSVAMKGNSSIKWAFTRAGQTTRPEDTLSRVMQTVSAARNILAMVIRRIAELEENGVRKF